MIGKPPQGLFVAGTGTGVGKTHVAAALARALARERRRVGVYKPAASGCHVENGRLVSTDATMLWEAAGRPLSLDAVCPQRFAAPLAPHLAARAEGREIDARLLREGLLAWRDYEIVIVEGAGGLMSPLGDDEYVADLAYEFGYPLVIVAANELGAIAATLQTFLAAGAYRGGLPVAGVVLSRTRPPEREDISVEANLPELRRRLPGLSIGELSYRGHDIEPRQIDVILMDPVRRDDPSFFEAVEQIERDRQLSFPREVDFDAAP